LSMQNGPIPIHEAARLAGVDVAQIHRWAEIGGVDIQGRGTVETVLLDQVMAMSAPQRRLRSRNDRDSLRARLADAKVQNTSVSDLQRIARGDSPS
jgi:hypothetical protein